MEKISRVTLSPKYLGLFRSVMNHWYRMHYHESNEDLRSVSDLVTSTRKPDTSRGDLHL